ncbi:MAG: hypothetical protein CSA38_04325 [Flavobacteriales bacterium]|nr:MAG: hypothetical protein CSA38_04325 [Flavobacteriales bacterium]
MKKQILFILFLLFAININAQYGTAERVLTRLEQRKGLHQEQVKKMSISGKKFVLIKDFKDHTERKFISFDGKKVTYVELIDDKKTGKTSSKVFTGDMMRNKHNVVSIRANYLEGKRIPIAITKTMVFMQLDDKLYLIDANTKEEWIERLDN